MNNIPYSVNCVLIRHNNAELQDKLKSMGFIDLRWTTNLEERQNLIASSYPHTVKGFSPWVGNKIHDKKYQGSFWCCGVGEPKKYSNVKDVGDDEELFIELASRIMNEREIWFENGEEIEKPKWA